MKTSTLSPQRGSALVTTVLFCTLLLVLIASIMQYSLQERRLNNRAKLLTQARTAAEALSEYGIAQVKKKLESSRVFTDSTWSGTDQSLFITGGSYAGTINKPETDISNFWDGTPIVTSGANAPTMHVGKIMQNGTGLFYIDPTIPDNDSDPLKGKRVFRYDLTILSSATAQDGISGPPLTKYMKQTFSIRAVPLFSHAVYYNMDLELWPLPLMKITGSTHTNQRLFAATAGSNDLSFAGPVTAVKGFWTKHSNSSPSWKLPFLAWNTTSNLVSGSISTPGSGAVKILKAGTTTTYVAMYNTTTGFTPNLTTQLIESTWQNVGATWQAHIGQGVLSAETSASKENFGDWIKQQFNGNLLTNVNGIPTLTLEGIPDYSYVYGSEYPDPIAGTTDAAYTYISTGNDKPNSAHAIIEPPRAATSPSYVAAIEKIKYAPNVCLYIVANTTASDATTGHKPDGTTITVKARSYRAFRNDSVEVILPGQDTFGDAGTPNPYPTHKNARPIVQLMDIDLAPGSTTFNQETTTQRRMYDLRRTMGGTSSSQTPDTSTFLHGAVRSTTNIWTPKRLDMIDIDMTELKKAVQTMNPTVTLGSTATSTAEFYTTGIPTDSGTAGVDLWANFIYNAAAVPAATSLSDRTRIITTDTSTLTNAFSTSTWNGAVYVESIAADLFDTTGGTTAAAIAARKAMTHESRNSGVRLINCRGKVPSLAANEGFTFVSNDAVYVLGSFNADGNSGTPATVAVSDPPSVGASTGHNYETSELPASIAADSITLLSQPTYTYTSSTSTFSQSTGWNDNYSDNMYASGNDGVTTSRKPYKVPYNSHSGLLPGGDRTLKPPAAFSEYAVAMLTGLVPTGKNGVNQNSGGLHNFPRFLEDWSCDCRIRGSFVALFESRVATEPWSIRVYQPPNRIWGFNLLYGEGKMPPLTPKAFHYRRIGTDDITKAQYSTTIGAWGY